MSTNIWNVITSYYITSPVWLTLSILSLLYLFYVSSKEAKKKMLICLGLTILIILNEFSYRILIKLFDAASYYRFLWCLPYVMLVALAIVICIRRLIHKKEPLVAGLFLISLACLMFFSQGNMVSRMKLDFPQNKYEVKSDVLQLKDVLEAEKENRENESEIVIACPLTVTLQYQTIDAKCIIVTDRNTYLVVRDANKTDLTQCSQDVQDAYLLTTICEDNAQPDADQAIAALQRRQIDYMIVGANVGMESYMESLGCTQIAQTDSYLVYRNDRM